jgi:long chain fatty acid CoA ligase FadD10
MSLSYPTVLQRVYSQARQRPDAVALRRCDGTSELRYAQLVAETERLAARLRAESVSRGSRVFVLSDDGPETYLAVLACARLGAVAVMADGALPDAAIERFSELTSPDAILVAPQTSVKAGKTRAGALPESLRTTPVIELDLAAPGAGPLAPENADHSDEHAAAGTQDDPLAMVFTSGTTGEPKAVLLPNRSFFAIPEILRAEGLRWIDWIPGELSFTPLPATHIGGLWWVLCGLTHGAVCVTGGAGASSLAEVFAENKIATACLVPTLLARLVRELAQTGDSLPALRLLVYGGSRAVASDVRFIEGCGARTAQIYGLSETGCTAFCLPAGEGSIAKIADGSVGRPYPGVQVCLVDDGGTPAAEDDMPSASFGTLWIKSPANMLEYWNNPERTRQVMRDGWVNTGDLVERRDDGFFFIRGRSSEMIISGGVNIAPDEVDRIAESVPGVHEAACYEIPDPEFGALVGLAVVPSAQLDGSAAVGLKRSIAARYRRESEPIARPSAIEIVTDIPRTSSGKVRRSALAASLNGQPVGAAHG